jgi:putative transposase
VFFSFILDVFSRRIIGWQLATNMRTTRVLDALRMALGTRQPGADFTLVAHTDQGSQYVSYDYTQVLDDAACSRQSGQSATRSTTRWPRASSTRSRPS